MKIRAMAASLGLVWLTLASAGAQDTASTPASDYSALKSQIKTKMSAGQRSAEALAPELAAFDALLVKYQNVKTEEVAQIAFDRATLYLMVLKDAEKGNALIKQLKADYPGTAIVAKLNQGGGSSGGSSTVSADKSALVGKLAPELHFNWSSREGMKTLSSLKGKVVILDFWATWCGPCIGSFPKIRELAEHYKGFDVEIIGVTSIQGKVANLESRPIDTQGDPAREMALMGDFIKAKEIIWPIAISEEPVGNKDYAVTGIPHVTIIAPDGTVRHNGLHPNMPHEQKTEMIDAILKEFRLRLPTQKGT